MVVSALERNIIYACQVGQVASKGTTWTSQGNFDKMGLLDNEQKEKKGKIPFKHV